MTTTPSARHVGRSWTGHPVEDRCPCPQEPCGLVAMDRAAPDCAQHTVTRTMRQQHAADACPGGCARCRGTRWEPNCGLTDDERGDYYGCDGRGRYCARHDEGTVLPSMPCRECCGEGTKTGPASTEPTGQPAPQGQGTPEPHSPAEGDAVAVIQQEAGRQFELPEDPAPCIVPMPPEPDAVDDQDAASPWTDDDLTAAYAEAGGEIDADEGPLPDPHIVGLRGVLNLERSRRNAELRQLRGTWGRYWRGEARAAYRERDTARAEMDRMRTQRNDARYIASQAYQELEDQLAAERTAHQATREQRDQALALAEELLASLKADLPQWGTWRARLAELRTAAGEGR